MRSETRPPREEGEEDGAGALESGRPAVDFFLTGSILEASPPLFDGVGGGAELRLTRTGRDWGPDFPAVSELRTF